MRDPPIPRLEIAMNKLSAVKLAARVIVGAGTTTISSSIIRNNVQPTTVIEQISTGVASVVIGSMASEATRAHAERRIDEVVDAWNSAKSKSTEPTEA